MPEQNTSQNSPSERDGAALDYSIFILTRNEADNLKHLLPLIHEVLKGEGASYEIVIVDGASKDNTVELAESMGATVYQQKGDGYGSAFREGIGYCRGDWIITLDADHSHPPPYLRTMIANKQGSDMLIGSRYIPGGDSNSEAYRNFLSKILSVIFGRMLGVPVYDVSSGFRMYRREVIQDLELVGRDFDVLVETLIRIVSGGYQVREIPFVYAPRDFGHSNARVFKFAISYLRTLKRMWNLRNSPDAADYEERAYRSWIPLQRYWQRKRTKHILDLAERNAYTLDVGSGASRVSRSLSRLVAVDKNPRPLRFLAANGVRCVEADLNKLPFDTNTFEQVILSQVLQHVPREELSLDEIIRVLKPGGIFIVATPDYSKTSWKILEWFYKRILPHAPGSLHKARYTRADVEALLTQHGFQVEETKSIFDADVVYRARFGEAPQEQVPVEVPYQRVANE